MRDKYDYLVIGSGPAGYTSAITASQLGLRTAVVEKDAEMLGGVCLNEGCIPAKSLYNSAAVLDLTRKYPEISGSPRPGKELIKSFVKRSRDDAARLRQGILFLFRKNGIELINARAEFVDASTLKLTESGGLARTVRADNILIASGSSPRALDDMPFDGKKVFASSHAIRLEEVPGKVLIIGGGAIGSEFASFFNIMGADVTLAEMRENIIPEEDRDVSVRLRSIFEKSGIKVITSSGEKVFRTGDYDAVIVSVGRVPYTAGFGIENAGIETDEKGFIPVDEMMRTRVKGIYAAGDVLSTPMLAHMASAEGEAAAMSAAGKAPAGIDRSSVPNAVYSRIQAASVGLTEDEAVRRGLDISVGKQFFKANGKAVVSGETEGFIKIIADNKTRKILGAHILGVNATELIHEFALARRKGLTVDDIAETVHAHPTFSESAVDAARSVFGRPVHG